MQKVDLSSFDNRWYKPGASLPIRLLWYVVNALFFQSPLLMPYAIKRALLRLFGAKVGAGVVVKPRVSIKYPWQLTIGKNCWIGEQVWIDSLAGVSLGDNVCLSQGALLLSGNHDYTKTSFDLMVKPIKIEDGAWIGAKSIVVGGSLVGEHAMLAAGSVCSSQLDAYGIYRGNPASLIKKRVIA